MKRESHHDSLFLALYSEDSALKGPVLGNGCPKTRRQGAGTLKSSYLSLIKQRRLIVIDLLEDSPHEGLANETATVLDLVPLAESVQRALLTVVEQDTYPIFSRGFFH